ncbi:hypothetical protein DFH09DRAFT_1174257 [Mycena vulgaris]|nr:hypothetical protein DFH09DRAFT_1174257 [Mycena vulgaris]
MSASRAQDHSRSINVSSPLLITQLNQLLTSLDIPITVQSHVELTPLLLVGILESLLSSRLPMSEEDRAALSTSRTAKVHCMKIFLGMLQGDLLQQDVGLSNVDPRRLASGAGEETIFVGRLLCWYGRRKGLIARPPGADPRNQSGSSSTLTSITHGAEMSPARAFSSVQPESDTSVSAGPNDADSVQGSSAPHPPTPRCIHEVPSPSLVLSPVSAHPDLETGLASLERMQNTTVRYSGYIELVDQDAEIAAFEEEKRRRLRRLGKRRQPDKRPPDLEVSILLILPSRHSR